MQRGRVLSDWEEMDLSLDHEMGTYIRNNHDCFLHLNISITPDLDACHVESLKICHEV